MKLVVIGSGQCGSRVADEFARLNKRAKARRGIEIVTGVFAVNTDAADLSGLSTIRADYQHRILIGGRKTSGHGVGKINELGAEVAKEDGDKVIDSIRTSRHFFETDAFLIAASAAGGTGSGSLPVIAQMVKDRYMDKPVYALVVLPFEHEEQTEERTTYNAATCLKSINTVADAVFLVDNQRYVRKDASLRNNLAEINAHIVAPFYNLLCAGEEKKARHIGAKVLDAGDILQTLVGWTTIGFGKTPLSMFKLPFERVSDFRKKSTETHKGIMAMDEAISELSIRCKPADAGRALYLISAPAKEMNMNLAKELGDYLKDIASDAIIRNGDYPRERGALEVTVILSELSDVDKIKTYYSRAAEFIKDQKTKQVDVESKQREFDEASKNIPTLL
jgi:cell division GTPase FtsZ